VIAWIRNLWRHSGTKILGLIQAVFSTCVSLLAVLASDPQAQLIIPPRAFAYLSVANAMLGVLTIKRGFTNTRNANPPP
jgi:hypothetical protein